MEILLDTLKWSMITGILTLALALLRPIFERRYNARWRYWAWLVLAVLALLAPVQWEKLVPNAPAVSTPVVIDVPRVAVHISQGAGVSVRLLDESDGPSALFVTAPKGVSSGWTVNLDRTLMGLWLTGMAVFLLYTITGSLLFRRKAQRWSRGASEGTLDLYNAVWRDMGLEKAPSLRISREVRSPMLLGVLRPCLLLPGEEWNELELSFILRHELTHYRRRDLWYKLVLLAANAIHWFNPLLYLMVREANADMELTCDGEVVAGADAATRRAYSETLLGAVRRNRGPGTTLSTNFYGGKAVMKERLRNILNKRGRKWGGLVLSLTLLAALACACSFGLRQADAAASALVLRNEASPVQDEGIAERDEVQAYIDSQIARLSGEGVTVTDQRSKFSVVDAFNWDVYDSEIQVWKLDYALKLAQPNTFTPAGSQTLDADGWLSGIDGQGEPHFIYSVYHGGEEPVINLEEIAYSNVEWEYGYTWEEYACCHTLFGLDLSPVPNGWPEASTDFLTALANGHETWSTDWEDVALSYLTKNGEEPGAESLSPFCVFAGNETHDEARLTGFLTASGRTGNMLLTHISYPMETEGQSTTVSFWQIAGILWYDQPET